MGVLLMGDKERHRKSVLDMVILGKLTLTQAAEQCNLCYRQMQRIYKEYKEKGDAGLIHKSRSKPSNRKHQHRDLIISIYKEKYDGFGPTLASEYLKIEDGIVVDHETLRRMLIAEGLWKKTKSRSKFRKHRERKFQFGELVQIDGSIHDWFDTGKLNCLMNMVDDATGTSLALMYAEETSQAALECLKMWIDKYGIPLAVYVDLKNVYVAPKNLSHFEKACQRLNIKVIKAHSPQAKGRVERNHAVYQDRLVKELKFRGLKTISEANKLLSSGFVDNLNDKFAKKPANPFDAHQLVRGINLDEIICWEFERQLQNDYTATFRNQTYQVRKSYGIDIKPKMNIQVRLMLNGHIKLFYKDQALQAKKIKSKPIKIKHEKKAKSINLRRKGSGYYKWKSSNHDFFKKKKP